MDKDAKRSGGFPKPREWQDSPVHAEVVGADL
jgi:hypothetical protein